jgi:nitroreductase/NAD-dependent dihydropyrimidine dehydrogenase PreA subunit
MDWSVTTVINPDICTGCGLCVNVCPADTISLSDGKAVVTGNRSLGCGHCAAVCPVGAITVTAIDESLSQFATFAADHRRLPFGEYDVTQLVRLMASRRSCRNYADRPVDPRMLEDLVKIGITAPSATNSQTWTFTILPTRDAVLTLAAGIRKFFETLNAMAEKRLLRILLKALGKRELDDYYREYYQPVKDGLAEWDQTGNERLFHGAPALIIVASQPGASLPKEDALLASQNILLAAHAMGLGTCLVGMAVEAFKNDRSLKKIVDIPAQETVYSVIAVGYPAETYLRTAGRKPAIIRYPSMEAE